MFLNHVAYTFVSIVLINLGVHNRSQTEMGVPTLSYSVDWLPKSRWAQPMVGITRLNM